MYIVCAHLCMYVQVHKCTGRVEVGGQLMVSVLAVYLVLDKVSLLLSMTTRNWNLGSLKYSLTIHVC